MIEVPPAGLGTLLRHVLSRLDGDVQALYDEAGTDFRPRFYPVVQQLLCQASASVGALSSTIGVSQSAMTQTISEMKRVGIITSTPAADPRQRLVRLTAKGEQLAAQLQPQWIATAEAAVELDRELAAPLSEVLAAAIAALKRKPFRERIRERLQDG